MSFEWKNMFLPTEQDGTNIEGFPLDDFREYMYMFTAESQQMFPDGFRGCLVRYDPSVRLVTATALVLNY
jgi:hypothetical protein